MDYGEDHFKLCYIWLPIKPKIIKVTLPDIAVSPCKMHRSSVADVVLRPFCSVCWIWLLHWNIADGKDLIQNVPSFFVARLYAVFTLLLFYIIIDLATWCPALLYYRVYHTTTTPYKYAVFLQIVTPSQYCRFDLTGGWESLNSDRSEL